MFPFDHQGLFYHLLTLRRGRRYWVFLKDREPMWSNITVTSHERHDVRNPRQFDCFFNHLLGITTAKTTLCITGNSRNEFIGGFASQKATISESVSIWERQATPWQSLASTVHEDVIKGKYFPRYWPFVRGIHRSQVNFSHKGQWLGALMFSLICAWTNGWVKQWKCRLFETSSCSLWRHCNVCFGSNSLCVPQFQRPCLKLDWRCPFPGKSASVDDTRYDWLVISIGSGNGLVQSRWRAIIRAIDGPAHWRLHTSPGFDVVSHWLFIIHMFNSGNVMLSCEI